MECFSHYHAVWMRYPPQAALVSPLLSPTSTRPTALSDRSAQRLFVHVKAPARCASLCGEDERNRGVDKGREETATEETGFSRGCEFQLRLTSRNLLDKTN